MNIKNIKQNRGAAMMILVIFMLFISLTIIIGIVTPVVRESQIAHDSYDSKQSYFTAESGIEDAIYRVKNSMTISSSENIVLGTSSTTTTITDLGNNQKEFASLGTTENHERKVDAVIAASSGAAFSYGIQVGAGGLDIQDGAVIGNVYSNGPITATSNGDNKITGSAISANSPSLTADQSNGSGTPANNVNFGNATATEDTAQSFKVSTDGPVNKVQLYIKKTSTPSNATVTIRTDSSGAPGSTIIATGTLSAASVTTTYGWVTVSFTTNPQLLATDSYWFVINSSVSSTKYYTIGATSGGYANGQADIGTLSTNSWSSSGLDYYFNLYLGSASTNGSIIGSDINNKLKIGTTGVGDAKAHTVNYVNAQGTVYCASGTGNNKSCTSATDPVPQDFPVSDSNIAQWKTDAVAGGVINGNLSVSGGQAGSISLGPKKIVGNLSVSGGSTLTLTGTVWVTGTVTFSGGSTTQLSSGYGTNDGIIVADGTVNVSGGSTVTGSGTSGSYIMVTSLDSTANAMNISGGSGALILYAPYGTLTTSGGVHFNQATAYKISLGGNSTITYDTGVSDLSFAIGPAGAYNIQSWGETQ